jgi:hypothetical protein
MHAHSLASPLRMVLTGGEDRSTRFCTSAVNRSEFTRRIQSGPAPGQPEADDESRPTSARPLPGKSTRLAAGPPPAERLYVLSPDAAPVPPAPCPQAHTAASESHQLALRKASSSRPRRLLLCGMPRQSPHVSKDEQRRGVGGRVRAEEERAPEENGSGGWEWGAERPRDPCCGGRAVSASRRPVNSESCG